MSTSPDSALALVRGIDGSSLPTGGLRARHALLLTMAQDKCYIDAVEDSTIQVAYDYYHHRPNKRNRLLSTYYLGVIRQNAEDYINAALAFREAEPLAEELEDYRQLSLIEQHLSRIFASNCDYVRALDYSKKALDAAERAGEKLMANYCRLDIAKQYLTEGDYSSAERELAELSELTDRNADLSSRILLDMARVLIYKPDSDFSSAKELLLKLQQIRSPEKLNKDVVYLTKLAIIYEFEGNRIESEKYMKNAFESISSPEDSVVFYDSNRTILQHREDWKEAYSSLSLAYKTEDRIVTRLLRQSITHSLEKSFEEKLKKEKAEYHSRLYLEFLLGICLALVIGVLFSAIRKKDQRLLEDMALIQEVSEDFDALKADHAWSYNLIGQLISDKVQSLQQLSESYFSWEDAALKKQEEQKGKLMKDEIISAFRKQLGELREEKYLVPALEQSLDLYENGLMKKARLLLKKEKELDYEVLALLFSGFSVKSISYLLRMSEASIRTRKTRYKQQFDKVPEPDRSIFLKKLG